MGSIVVQLFSIFAPIAADLIKHYQADHSGATPTIEELTALFNANIDHYLGEGAAWSATHPVVPPPSA